jgi:biotin transporter BioY
MIKRKGVTTVAGIALIAVCGWVTLVSLVLTDNFWIGSALSLVGGAAIGLVVAYLMRRWWFKGIEKRQ